MIKITESWRSRFSRLMSSKICDWIVTSSAVVGLVADQDVRVRRKGDGNHDSLAHTAGELEGILVIPFARLGNADLLHQLYGAGLGDPLCNLCDDARRVFFQVVDERDRLPVIVPAFPVGEHLLIMRNLTCYQMANVVLDKLQIGNGRRGKRPARGFAAFRQPVVFCLASAVFAFGLHIFADRREITVDLAGKARGEGVAQAVLYDREVVDRRPDLFRKQLLRMIARGVVKLLFLKNRQVFAQDTDSLLHIAVGNVRGIHQPRRASAIKSRMNSRSRYSPKNALSSSTGIWGSGLPENSR